MTATEARTAHQPQAPRRRGRGARFLQILGWTLLSAGAVVLLYVVYAMYFTNLETDSAQREMRDEWERVVGVEDDGPGLSAPDEDHALDPSELEGGGDGDATGPEEGGDGDATGPDVGSAIAAIEFVRPGSDERPVHDDPLFVVDDVTRDALTRGPGHYPTTAMPGAEGNFAVAGHRVTYGAPFHDIDELRDGDEIHVTDRDGTTHVYRFVEQRIVWPHESWVLGEDPLDRGGAMITLTACHPRYSARERIIVFGELVS